MREIIVEMRKCFLRLDFYGALLIFSGIVSFFIYQLCTDGAVIKIEGATEALSFNELLLGILQMTNSIGLTGILLAILSWRTLGKEMDQKSIIMYILHSRNKWKVFFAKFITLLLAFIVIVLIAILISFFIFTFTAPTKFDLITSGEAIKHFLSILFLIICSSAVSILLACVLSLKFGTLGVLASTIGLSIFSAILQFNETIKYLLPINLTQLENTTMLYNSCILGIYILVLLISLNLLTRYRELRI